MKEILIFAIGATVSGSIFLVAIVELLFTIRRRKVKEELSVKLQELKKAYSESMTKLASEGEEKAAKADEKVQAVEATIESEKAALSSEFQEKIDSLEKESDAALTKAKAKAKKLEEEAKLKADAYLESRKTEVEQELMNLVMNVTKKVLPETLSYDLQKELVIRALEDAKTGNTTDDK